MSANSLGLLFGHRQDLITVHIDLCLVELRYENGMPVVQGGVMTGEFSPRTYQIVIEGIADSYFVNPHFRAFIETDSQSPTVLMTTNNVSEPDKVDFENATGGTRVDDGRSGIFIYMRWTNTPRMGDAVTVTVWQQGATEYGRPEKLPEAGFDPDAPTAIFKQGPLAPHDVA